jgi:hypothetical protein
MVKMLRVVEVEKTPARATNFLSPLLCLRHKDAADNDASISWQARPLRAKHLDTPVGVTDATCLVASPQIPG